MRKFTAPPSLADIEALANDALGSIPDSMRRLVRNVPILILDFPDEDLEEEMGLESPFDLLGIYAGVPETQKSLLDVSTRPDMILLFRRPILDYWCETAEELAAIVRHVLIHEIGHHFGFSDDDMDRIEGGAY